MSGYRLYLLDRFSGHIDQRRDFIADGDAEAIEIAHNWYDGNPMELWLGGRKLRHWDAAPLAPLSASEGFTSAGG